MTRAPLKVLVASGGFKGTMDPREASNQIAKSLRAISGENLDVRIQPLADGGRGTLKELSSEIRKRPSRITGPFGPNGERRTGLYLEVGPREFLVETADFLSPNQGKSVPSFDPEFSSSYGLGRFLLELLEENPRTIILGLGDSLTFDGGAGALQALGATLTNSEGAELDFFKPGEPVSKKLLQVSDVQLSSSSIEKLMKIQIKLLCDSNVTLGEAAEAIRQKLRHDSEESRRNQIERVKAGWQNLAKVLISSKSPRIGNPINQSETSYAADTRGGLPCGGAIAIGMHLGLGADLLLGSDYFASTLRLDAIVSEMDVVITGEGSLDDSSFRGKVLSRALSSANRSQVPCFAIVGSISETIGSSEASGSRDSRNLAHRRDLAGIFELFPDVENLFRAHQPLRQLRNLKSRTPEMINYCVDEILNSPMFNARTKSYE